MVSGLAKTNVAQILTGSATALRIYAYTRERFPLGTYAAATALFFSSGYLLARLLSGLGPPGTELVLGGTVTLLVFFHLRVMDEHKDGDFDARVHPDRPVPRGLVSLTELRWLGAAAVALEVLLSAVAGPAALIAYLAVLAYTVAMYREFEVGEWLRARTVLYTLIHMLVVPLLAVYAYATAAGEILVDPAFLPYLGLSYAIGLLLEIGRKVRAPTEERAEVFTYSQRFGVRGVAVVVIGLLAGASLCALAIGWLLGFELSYPTGVVTLAALVALAIERFGRAPTARSARLVEAVYTPTYVAGVYLLTIAHALARMSAS